MRKLERGGGERGKGRLRERNKADKWEIYACVQIQNGADRTEPLSLLYIYACVQIDRFRDRERPTGPDRYRTEQKDDESPTEPYKWWMAGDVGCPCRVSTERKTETPP